MPFKTLEVAHTPLLTGTEERLLRALRSRSAGVGARVLLRVGWNHCGGRISHEDAHMLRCALSRLRKKLGPSWSLTSTHAGWYRLAQVEATR